MLGINPAVNHMNMMVYSLASHASALSQAQVTSPRGILEHIVNFITFGGVRRELNAQYAHMAYAMANAINGAVQDPSCWALQEGECHFEVFGHFVTIQLLGDNFDDAQGVRINVKNGGDECVAMHVSRERFSRITTLLLLKARHPHLDIPVHLTPEGEIDLCGADLHNANLAQIDLRNAKLDRAILREANLLGSTLSGASVAHADLRYASLAGSDLRHADLRHSLLIGTGLSRTQLTGARLAGADLSEAKLELVELSGANFRGAYFSSGAHDQIALCLPAKWTMNLFEEHIYTSRTGRKGGLLTMIDSISPQYSQLKRGLLLMLMSSLQHDLPFAISSELEQPNKYSEGIAAQNSRVGGDNARDSSLDAVVVNWLAMY